MVSREMSLGPSYFSFSVDKSHARPCGHVDFSPHNWSISENNSCSFISAKGALFSLVTGEILLSWEVAPSTLSFNPINLTANLNFSVFKYIFRIKKNIGWPNILYFWRKTRRQQLPPLPASRTEHMESFLCWNCRLA